MNMTRSLSHAITVAAACSVLCVVAAAQQRIQRSARVLSEVKHDVSAPLAELDRMTPAPLHRFTPRMLQILPTGPAITTGPSPESAAPDVALPPVAANIGLNMD